HKPREQNKKSARGMVNSFTRPDFEQAKSRQRDKDAIDAIKMLFYNKAHIYYACLVSTGRVKFWYNAVSLRAPILCQPRKVFGERRCRMRAGTDDGIDGGIKQGERLFK